MFYKQKISLKCLLLLCILMVLSTSIFINDSINVKASDNIDTSNFTNLIVFVKFADEEEFINDKCSGNITVKNVIENSYTKANYSVKDYYEKVSNGKVKMNNLYLFTNDNSSITLSKSRGYYCSKDINNAEGYDSSEYYTRLYELKADWANAINNTLANNAKITNVDATITYPYSVLDRNLDSYLDSLTIVYKYSDKYSVSWSDCLWNYQDYYTGINFKDEKVNIQSGSYFQMTANFNYLYHDQNGLSFSSLNTMIHETGHIFGLKDLYKSASNSPVYFMSAMAKAISPVPQYISYKEREALGWVNNNNSFRINQAGEYEINVTSSDNLNDDKIICYKIKIPNKDKMLYLEYRNFNDNYNKYDCQKKEVYNENNNKINGNSLKSGLVCFLASIDSKFPNNMNVYGNNWNYEVLGGNYSTKSDAALAVNETLSITNNLQIQVLSIKDDILKFKVLGNDIEKDIHIHNLSKINKKESTCIEHGNIAYYHCLTCNKYFSDESANNEITLEETILKLALHKEEIIKGYNATCLKTGLSDGKRCKVCLKVLKEQETINKLEHVSSSWIIDKQETYENEGLMHKECLNCKTLLEEKVIDKLENNTNDSSNDGFTSEIVSDNNSNIISNDNKIDSSSNQDSLINQNGCKASFNLSWIILLLFVFPIFKNK